METRYKAERGETVHCLPVTMAWICFRPVNLSFLKECQQLLEPTLKQWQETAAEGKSWERAVSSALCSRLCRTLVGLRTNKTTSVPRPVCHSGHYVWARCARKDPRNQAAIPFLIWTCKSAGFCVNLWERLLARQWGRSTDVNPQSLWETRNTTLFQTVLHRTTEKLLILEHPPCFASDQHQDACPLLTSGCCCQGTAFTWEHEDDDWSAASQNASQSRGVEESACRQSDGLVWSLEPTRWKDGTASHKPSSDLHMCYGSCTRTHTHAHKFKIRKVFEYKIL